MLNKKTKNLIKLGVAVVVLVVSIYGAYTTTKANEDVSKTCTYKPSDALTNIIEHMAKPNIYEIVDMTVKEQIQQEKDEEYRKHLGDEKQQVIYEKMLHDQQQVASLSNPEDSNISTTPSRGGNMTNTYIRTEVSFYSINERTDEVGCENMNAHGSRLKDGDIAMPIEYPPYTKVVFKDLKTGDFLRDSNGDIKIYTNTDRGNSSYIRVFDNPGKNGAEIRVDMFMGDTPSIELSSIGLKYYDMLVVRYGRNGQRLIMLPNKKDIKVNMN